MTKRPNTAGIKNPRYKIVQPNYQPEFDKFVSAYLELERVFGPMRAKQLALKYLTGEDL